MKTRGGYAGTFLHVDLNKQKIIKQETPEGLVSNYLGGRGFTSRIQWDEVDPATDALSPENGLILTTGPLTGTAAPSSARYVAGGRSPLTGILGDANSGGFWGPELKLAGYDAVIFRGKAAKPSYLWIEDDTVELRDAQHLWGKTTLETEDIIEKEASNGNIQALTIGPAGENLVRVAGIANTDHFAARTGLGALMGSKNIKAVAVRGTKGIRVAEEKTFQDAVSELVNILMTDKQSAEVLPKYGTPMLVTVHNTLGGMATRNMQTGYFENAEKIDEDALRDGYTLKARGCYACPTRCDRYTQVKEGEFKGTHVGGPEYYTIVAFGSRLGIDNLAAVIKANELVNLYGLDAASTGSIIGFAMECFEKGIITVEDTHGLDLSWGNYNSMLKLIDQIAHREGFGAVLADGVRVAADRIGKGAHKYAMHVKGLDVPVFDPRALRVYNFRYAIATRGSDHLRISVHAAYELENLPTEEAAEKLKFWQEIVALPDIMGVCKFPYVFFSSNAEITIKKALTLMTRIYNAATGLTLTEKDLMTTAERVATTERAVNAKLGITRKDDTLPRRFMEEPLTGGA
ncbi:MAG: aldehyde ferredoxin oxidoreductase family protein, partial [Candidatus Bathyarchaeia archaeon]